MTYGYRRAPDFCRPARSDSVGDVLGSRWIALGLAGVLACSSSTPKPASAGNESGVVRYRLELRNNPVSAGDAFRCYGGCQSASSPQAYLDCLAACPGFEVTPGVRCSKEEVPPVAACLTVRKIPRQEPVPAGAVVLATVGAFLLVVGAASLCAASSSQCGYVSVPPPF